MKKIRFRIAYGMILSENKKINGMILSENKKINGMILSENNKKIYRSGV